MRFIPDLDDAVAVVPDSTVSKVVVKEGPLRLVMFGFDQGQELTEHTAAVPVVIQVVSGSLTLTTAGGEHRLDPRSWLYLDAGEAHSVVAHEPTTMLLTMLRDR
jgi:quercetin dioxygenase-like cupin family protein